ncbi:ABC transporter permease [Paenibacillus radicis (ex Xue et al. 2023)]|uniref:Sugar ABC transporter permease n=1 Tax=Paenibacillus radicis (ex Xue et al. 2023) TaxID=2972489 RepID=A0ABT1YRL3_9BACL|nr:sugar ABC transporter permease [Paenibacillus radicis (ex Xue et al. 2023)]MCR8635824.1 sugar ABC transporter permease [Paenibacillus radicis (ex Xue et al. 2023)]
MRKSANSQSLQPYAAYRGNAGSSLLRYVIKKKWSYFMLLPGVLYFIIFKYFPMWGVIIAFQNYQPFLGLFHSPWVGLEHFHTFFSDASFWQLFRNTAILAVYNLVFYFPVPIIVALMLNEVRTAVFKRFVQTVIYIPHFVSWVVVIGMAYVFFTTEGGVINELIARMFGQKLNLLVSASWFRPMMMFEVIWKDTGWGTIIFLAALAGVDPQLYEAARMDGAGRMRQLWHITLPAIRSTIVVLLILRLGHFLDTGFEQIFLSLNAMNREIGEVFETYVYRMGIQQGRFSYSTAVGLFKSVIGLILVAGANYLAKKLGEEGVY